MVLRVVLLRGSSELFFMLKLTLNRYLLQEFILREDLKLIKSVSYFHLLTHFHVLSKYVVALRTVARQLVVAIPLIYICTLNY